jgi:hypothetical protein
MLCMTLLRLLPLPTSSLTALLSLLNRPFRPANLRIPTPCRLPPWRYAGAGRSREPRAAEGYHDSYIMTWIQVKQISCTTMLCSNLLLVSREGKEAESVYASTRARPAYFATIVKTYEVQDCVSVQPSRRLLSPACAACLLTVAVSVTVYLAASDSCSCYPSISRCALIVSGYEGTVAAHVQEDIISAEA